MSAKWQRSRRWDDEHLRGPLLLPVKLTLRALSSITLAVITLSLIALYGVLASIPIGLLALIPTVLIYSATFVLAVAIGAGLPAWGVSRFESSLGRGLRTALVVLVFVGLGALAGYAWYALAWPVMRYDAYTGAGFRLFADFVARTDSITVRRLPLFEMTELEFYAWWPMRGLLVLFVVNMVVATLRRIEFRFVNIGVLTVHTGIVLIALGSIHYARYKQEGDLVLFSAVVDQRAFDTGVVNLGPGREVTGFYDNIDVALWVRQGGAWDERLVRGVPRYNDYNLDVAGAAHVPPETTSETFDRGRSLSVRVPESSRSAALGRAIVDDDIRFRIVGYAQYADASVRWVRQNPSRGARPNPVRFVEALLAIPDERGEIPEQPRHVYRFMPERPIERVEILEGLLAVEYTMNMGAERWDDLTAALPTGARHALIVEVPTTTEGPVLADDVFRGVYRVEEGQRIEVGRTGWTIEVRQLLPEPPFPIITPGFENATSSLAVLNMTGPDGETFERWVYHRFPEINQDLTDEQGAEGMPPRRGPDERIRVAYADVSMIQVYLDERLNEDGEGSVIRAVVRTPGGVSVFPSVRDGGTFQVAPSFSLRLGERWEHGERIEVPRVIAESERNRSDIGSHKRAMAAVEVSVAGSDWKRMVWVPFTQYMEIAGPDRTFREVALPDGRRVQIVFGRRGHPFAGGLALQLTDFEMTPYPHSTVPRDFRSDLLVRRSGELFKASTSLNAPLLVRVPFQPRRDGSGVATAVFNVFGRVFDLIAPTHYKFSQAGWDASGWNDSRAAAERGEVTRPFARFTILGVGNNPGIQVIALGAVLMSLGIPWAFYVKPMLLRMQKRRIQASLRASSGAAPKRAADTSAPNGLAAAGAAVSGGTVS